MECDILSKFGAHLRELRTEKGFSQTELAYRGNFDRNYIGMIERGERNPSLKSIFGIAKALDITLQELFNFECNDNHK